MTQESVLRLFDYDLWANKRVLSIIENKGLTASSTPITRLFSHIIAAQEIWIRRILGESLQGLTPWPEIQPTEWQTRLDSVNSRWKTTAGDPQHTMHRVITYQNSRGDAFSSVFSDIATHVIIHGQHHRAQIALHLRERGITPPGTDYIFYTRSLDP